MVGTNNFLHKKRLYICVHKKSAQRQTAGVVMDVENVKRRSKGG